MDKRPQTVASEVIEFVAFSSIRRLVVVVGIPLVFVALFWENNVIGTTALLFAGGLVVFLYTRPTVQKTVAASAYATGVLMISLPLLELYWNWAGGSTASLAKIAAASLWQAVAGTLLALLGVWLRQIEA